MDFDVGGIYTGKVTGIAKFGAFVQLAPGKSGLVHISEIANNYVKDINDHLKEGQEVKVKVIGVDKNGRLNLSVSKTIEPAPPPEQPAGRPEPEAGAASSAFEQKLKQFMQASDSKMAGSRLYTDRKGSRRGNRK